MERRNAIAMAAAISMAAVSATIAFGSLAGLLNPPAPSYPTTSITVPASTSSVTTTPKVVPTPTPTEQPRGEHEDD